MSNIQGTLSNYDTISTMITEVEKALAVHFPGIMNMIIYPFWVKASSSGTLGCRISVPAYVFTF